jgi:hypothetical protein
MRTRHPIALQKHAFLDTALSIGTGLLGSIPGPVGAVAKGVGAAKDLWDGNYASAALNATGAGLQGAGSHRLDKWIGKTGLGETGQNVLRHTAATVAPVGNEHAGIPHWLGSSALGMGANIADSELYKRRPEVQQAQREQEEQQREFEEFQRNKGDYMNWRQQHNKTGQDWSQHRVTLQKLAAGTASHPSPPSAGDMTRDVWHYGLKASPYVLAAGIGGHALPSLYAGDTMGMLRGATTGGVSTAGALGGAVGGGVLGSEIAKWLSKPEHAHGASLVGAGIGGLGGALTGHLASRALIQNALDRAAEGDDEERGHRMGRIKYSSAPLSLLALRASFRKYGSTGSSTNRDNIRDYVSHLYNERFKLDTEAAQKAEAAKAFLTPEQIAKAPGLVEDWARKHRGIPLSDSTPLPSIPLVANSAPTAARETPSGVVEGSPAAATEAAGTQAAATEAAAAQAAAKEKVKGKGKGKSSAGGFGKFMTSPAGIATGVGLGAAGLGAGAYLLHRHLSRRRRRDDDYD